MAKTPWYSRWKDPKPAAGVGIGQQGQDRADYSGGISAGSTSMAYDYLRGSLRVNAPGYADQNYYEMSRAYVGAPYLAIHRKATLAGCAEVKIFEHGDQDDPESKKQLSIHEDVCDLINHPNPDESINDIVEQNSLQMDLTGTALTWVPHDVTDPHSQPEEMYVLSTASCLPQPISPLYPQGAYLVQPWYPAGPYATVPVSQGVGATVPAQQIIRVKTPHPFFRWIGYATMYAISMQIDSLKQVDVSRMNALYKGIDPTAVMTFDPSIRRPDDASLRRLEEQLRAIYGGAANTGRIFMAPLGADVKKLSNTPSEMAYQEGWSQLADFTMACIGTPKPVAGMVDEINYATLFASLRAFYLFTLNPFLGKFARAFTKHLIHPFYSREFFMEAKGQSITDEDQLDKKANTLGKLNVATVGEIRKMYDLEPSDRDDEWVGEGMDQGKQGQERGLAPNMQGGGGEADGPALADAHVERHRPKNEHGGGGRIMSPHDRQEQMGKAFEKAFSKGTARPHYANGRKMVPVNGNGRKH